MTGLQLFGTTENTGNTDQIHRERRLKCTTDGYVGVMFVQKWVNGYFQHMTTSICGVAFFEYRTNATDEQAHICLRYNGKKSMSVHFFCYFLAS